MVATHLDDVHALHFVLLHSHDTPKRLERPHDVRSEFRVVLFLLSVEKEKEMEGRDFSDEEEKEEEGEEEGERVRGGRGGERGGGRGERGEGRGGERGEGRGERGGGRGGERGERRGGERGEREGRGERGGGRGGGRRGSTCCTECRTVP